MEQAMAALLAGVLGGNVAGVLLRRFNLGSLSNTVLGVIGGGIGGTLLMASGQQGGELGLDGIAGQIFAGGLGGAALAIVAGWVLHRR